MKEIELGSTVTDVVSGFTGVVTGKVEYLTGCRQFLIQPKSKESSKMESSEWIDIQRLEVNDEPLLHLSNWSIESKHTCSNKQECACCGADSPAPKHN